MAIRYKAFTSSLRLIHRPRPAAPEERLYRTTFTLLLGAVALYFGAASYILHFQLNRILFPQTSSFQGPVAKATTSFKSKAGNELLVRRYGQASLGCVVFFPGQHGATASYRFSDYTAAGIAVFSLAYPGQDGASGRTEVHEIERLVGEAIAAIRNECPSTRTVFVGVSLGAMLATYASRDAHPVGLVLTSAAPSFSSALRVRLRSHLVSTPLSWLPLSQLLPHDYSLAEGLSRSPNVRVVIFQGTRDEQTPLELLLNSGILRDNVRLLSVPGGTHSTTFVLSRDLQLSTVLTLVQGA